ncbi:MAG: hypothetical protein QME78_10400, partial [Thermodesulfobacteriota bacterium]|nr:hypothetical protein [Thermodesulfobacteriota bacterium]
LFEFPGIDSFDSRDEIEMVVGGNNLFDPVMDHGGGMEGISRFNLGVGLQDLQCQFKIPFHYRQNSVGQQYDLLRQPDSSRERLQGLIAIEDFLDDFCI